MKDPLEFNSNTFEHDWIIKILSMYQVELKTDKEECQITDKYACEITAFMRGQILQAVQHTEERCKK